MDWDKAENELSKDLNKAHVKSRKQGGRDVSYIEAWMAIAEANRIFGFNGWTSETDYKLVSEREKQLSSGMGWSVSYIAKVRVTVDGITREGVGAGHGNDRDLGQAHESALKEAESDARKRALMTFGNPFGLALYDKTQANVSDAPQQPSDAFLDLRAILETIGEAKHLELFARQVKEAVTDGKLTASERATLQMLYREQEKKVA